MEDDVGRSRHVRLKAKYDVVFQTFLKVATHGFPAHTYPRLFGGIRYADRSASSSAVGKPVGGFIMATWSPWSYPNALEEVLVTPPELLQCAAIGVPDERSGEDIKAM